VKPVGLLLRSLLIHLGFLGRLKPWLYRLDEWRRSQKTAAFYRPFVAEGDLVFDIGAFLGGQTATFHALGAHVVAVEPQPNFAHRLRRRFHHTPEIVIIEAALSDTLGHALLSVDANVPEIASLHSDWISHGPTRQHAHHPAGIAVTTLTLGALIKKHGVPSFIKIDAEGHEHAILSTLAHPPRFLCFEIHRGREEEARRCGKLLAKLGGTQINFHPGDSLSLLWPEWKTWEAVDSRLWEGTAAVFGDLFVRFEIRSTPVPPDRPPGSPGV
jgi:FkbM family methyltransferase